ncbi:MAG: DUF3857 domain-containing protein [Lewinellaceae bacterium]|nr:DUF3857 domain-containing protein [Lewinellaceae bacterium]
MRFWFIVTISLLATCSQGQIASAGLIADSLRENARQIIRSESTQLRILNDNEAEITYSLVVTIIDNLSDAGDLVVGYDKDSPVSQFEAKLYDHQGNFIRKARNDEIKDYAAVDGFSVYQDNRIKVLQLTHSTYPFTIAFSYRQKLQGIRFASLPDWQIQSFHTAVESSSFEVTIPPDIPLLYEARNISLAPKIASINNNKKYSWQVTNLKAIVQEPYLPKHDQILPALKMALGKFRIDQNRGSMTSWEAFGQFIHQLFEAQQDTPAALQAEARQLVAGVTNRREKIDRLYRFMQQKMRYVSIQLGIGGWQPFPVSYVEQNKFGDCKALTNYMIALLAAVDIPAFPVLIEAGESQALLSPDFANSEFNHVILYIPDEDYWLECTSSYDPPNFLGAATANHQALLITPTGGKLITTPLSPDSSNVRTWTGELHWTPATEPILDISANFSGLEHEIYRALFHEVTADDRQKYLLREKFSHLAVNQVNKIDLLASPDEAKATLSLQATLARLGTRAGKRMFLPVNPLQPLTLVPPADDNRCFPVIQQQGYVETCDFQLTLPPGYSIEAIPFPDKELNSPYGTWKMHIEIAEDTIRIQRHLSVVSGKFPAAEYAAFSQFFRDVAKQDGNRIVLVQE